MGPRIRTRKQGAASENAISFIIVIKIFYNVQNSTLSICGHSCYAFCENVKIVEITI